MLGLLKRRGKPVVPARYSIPDDLMVYAIGDVHGCRAELDDLLDLIDRDCSASGKRIQLIFLGDLVDRGPDSAGVLDRLLSADLPGDDHQILLGNHEEAMLEVWDGHGDVVAGWLRFGGVQTLESYGMDRGEVFRLGIDLPKRMREVVPAAHIDFIRAFKDQVRVGGYLFVHAGVRPGLPFHLQEPNDMRWIREEFLDDERDHGAMVVHGHTITDTPELRSNRIGIDTGCYSSGQLTALVLEGTERRFLQTVRRR